MLEQKRFRLELPVTGHPAQAEDDGVFDYSNHTVRYEAWEGGATVGVWRWCHETGWTVFDAFTLSEIQEGSIPVTEWAEYVERKVRERHAEYTTADDWPDDRYVRNPIRHVELFA